MLKNGESVIEISKKARVSRGYVNTIKTCLKKGVPTTFYQKRFLVRNPAVKNKNRKKNYAKGALYDHCSHEPYTDQKKNLF